MCLLTYTLISARIWRHVSANTVLLGFDIPKDTAVLIPVNLVHSDSDYFFEPELFEPERWVELTCALCWKVR